jgi:hypothetical protein
MSKNHLERVRKFCLALPGAYEKLSHGEPTFFVRKTVFVMYANNHHNDGHVAVWVPVLLGVQESLIERDPKTFFRPPYMGVYGWVGIELSRIKDKDLSFYIQVAWEMKAPKRLLASVSDEAKPAKAARKKK